MMRLLTIVICLWLLPPGHLYGQEETLPEMETSPRTEQTPSRKRPSQTPARKEVFSVGQDITIETNERVREVVVVGGALTVKGEVDGDVLVVNGTATVENKIRGELLVVLGDAILSSQAHIRRDLTVVGGDIQKEPGAQVDGDIHPVVSPSLHIMFGWLIDWVKRGLFWGRPFVFQLSWMWVLTAILLGAFLLAQFMFPMVAQSCVTVLGTRPAASFFTGILVIILLGPLLLLLIVSFVGWLVIPILFCALLASYLFGKLTIYRFVGEQLGRGLRNPVLALVIGMALFYLLYSVPILGLLAWGAAVPFAIGVPVLALMASLKAESDRRAADTRAIGADLPPPYLAAGSPAVAGSDPRLRAGFWRRFLATLLDWIMFLALFALFHRQKAIWLMLWTAYHILMWSWKSTTIGGIVLGLKIVRLDGRPMTFSVALVRSLASYFSAFPLMLGFFWVGWDREKQSWHDKIAGTVVVRVPQATTLV